MPREGLVLWSTLGAGTVHSRPSSDTGLAHLGTAQQALFYKQISSFIDQLTEGLLLILAMKCHPI